MCIRDRLTTQCVRAELNVGGGEVTSLCQQGFAGELRQGIGKAVSEVERRRMAALSIVAPGRPRNLDLFAIHGDDLQVRPDNEKIEFPSRGFATPGFQYDPGFQY